MCSMYNQTLEISLLKFKISVTRNRLREVGKELGIIIPVASYPEVELSKDLFGESYRKEPVFAFPKIERKHAVAIGVLGIGVVSAIIAHHFKK